MSLVIAIRAISRRTGSKPDRMTVSGVSSMIRSIPVACSSARMLRPSRPMIRPFISSDGRWTTETVCSAVWSAATRWIAVITMSRALSWASSRALALDGPGDLDGVVLGLLADGLDQDALGVLGGHVGDPLERDDLLAVGAGEVLAGLVELALAVEQLAIALLEHVGALVELLVTLEEPASRGRRARRAGRGPLPRPRAACAASRPWLRGSVPSGGRGPRPRCGAPRRSPPSSSAMPTGCGRSTPTTAPPTAATTATATMSRGSIFCSSHPADCGPDVRDAVGGSIARWAGRVAASEGDPSLGRDRATAVMRAAETARGSSAA